MHTSLFLHILLFVGLYEASVCPSKEGIYPCKCELVPVYRMASEIRIDCDNILNPEQLAAPMTTIGKSKTEVTYLYIKNSSLLYLPDNLFRNTHIKEVKFFNSEIFSLSESDNAFSGLEDVLTEIRAVNVKFSSHWDFKQLRNLKALRTLYLHKTILRAVDHQFPHLPELAFLYIISAEITYVTDNAFSKIPKLRKIYMADNKITEMKRSMFSNPANSLFTIYLSKNRLSCLPDDFFENMPQLNQVSLDQNKFITLSEKPFSDVFGKIRFLYMSDNPFRCDCRLHWLVNVRFPPNFKGKCSTPKTLSGRDIATLDFKRLWC